MSAPLAQLQRLMRQAGARTPTRADRPAEPAMRAATNIADLRHTLRLREARQAVPVARTLDRHLPGEEIAPGLRLVTARLPIEPMPPMLDGAFDRMRAFDPRRVLFFDTETTGLAGGTGTRAFMLGVARWDETALEVRQLLITTLAAEVAMLEAFARAHHLFAGAEVQHRIEAAGVPQRFRQPDRAGG